MKKPRRRYTRLPSGSIIGRFSKGVDHAVAISFGRSGGRHCSRRCQHHPQRGGKCYAVTAENRFDRQELAEKLDRHEAMPAYKVVGQALLELQALVARGHTIPWLRFSTSGSLPHPSEAGGLFTRQLRALVRWAVAHEIPIHLPVETAGKASFYRELLGDLITVRESLQHAGDHLTTPGAVAWVAGADIVGHDQRRLRVEAARKEAAERLATTGRKAIVCPAITSAWRQRHVGNTLPIIHCGECQACSLPQFDVVYPQH